MCIRDRSHSSIGLERLATDEKVEGSSPSGTSKIRRLLMSLQNSVFVFFIVVLAVLFVISLIL